MLLGRVLPSPLPGEHVIFYLRRHWVTFVRKVAWYILLFIAPVVLYYLALKYYPHLIDNVTKGDIFEALFRVGVSVYYLGIWLFFWNAWVDYYLDVWLVTNERIVAWQQNGLFNRTLSETNLARVQDVTAQVQGFVATIFGYGKVQVQSAGTKEHFAFQFVPQATHVSEKILKLANECRAHHKVMGET